MSEDPGKADTKQTQATEYSPDFREYYVTSGAGQFTEDDFRIDFGNTSGWMLEDAGQLVRVRRVNVTLIMPKKHAMELGYWLIANVLREEEKLGREFPRSSVPTENLLVVLEKLKKFDPEKVRAELGDLRTREAKALDEARRKVLEQAGRITPGSLKPQK